MQLYQCDEFILQREVVFTNHFQVCLSKPTSSKAIIILLFKLTSGYQTVCVLQSKDNCKCSRKKPQEWP